MIVSIRFVRSFASLADVFTPDSDPAHLNDVYFVSVLMGADLSNILRIQRLTDEHIRFLVYQVRSFLLVSHFLSVADPARPEVHPLGRHHSSGLEAEQHRRERGLRAENPGLRTRSASGERNDRLREWIS